MRLTKKFFVRSHETRQFFLVDQKMRNRPDNWSTKRLTKSTWTPLIVKNKTGILWSLLTPKVGDFLKIGLFKIGIWSLQKQGQSTSIQNFAEWLESWKNSHSYLKTRSSTCPVKGQRDLNKINIRLVFFYYHYNLSDGVHPPPSYEFITWFVAGFLLSRISLQTFLCPFGVIVWTKIPTKFFPEFLP